MVIMVVVHIVVLMEVGVRQTQELARGMVEVATVSCFEAGCTVFLLRDNRHYSLLLSLIKYGMAVMSFVADKAGKYTAHLKHEGEPK